MPCVPAFLDWAPEAICQSESESFSVMSDSMQPHGLWPYPMSSRGIFQATSLDQRPLSHLSWPSSAPIWCLWPFKTFLPQHQRLCFVLFCWPPSPMRQELLQAGDHVSLAFPSGACQSASTEIGLRRGALKGREPPVGSDSGQKGTTQAAGLLSQGTLQGGVGVPLSQR